MAFSERATFAWLRLMGSKGVHLGGVSGGPVILARAGVMEGRRMTVHWEHAEALSESMPDLLLEKSIYVIDRDRMTCAGGIAAVDMIHSLISGHHGAAFARLVSDWFLHTEVRPAMGAQRGGLNERLGVSNANVVEAVRVMESRLAEPASLERIAAIVGLSPRQLGRQFRTHLGTSVMAYYEAVRINKAKSLLQNSTLSITQIALATGFANPSHFSTCFKKHQGIAPSAFRQSRQTRSHTRKTAQDWR